MNVTLKWNEFNFQMSHPVVFVQYYSNFSAVDHNFFFFNIIII
jgi:hypothetical protein